MDPSHTRGRAEVSAVFSLGCFWGMLHPPIVQIYLPISVSEAAAPPHESWHAKLIYIQ